MRLLIALSGVLLLSQPDRAATAAAGEAEGQIVQEIQIIQRTPAGQAQLPPRDQPERKTGTARIRGRVVRLDTGAPLRRALISLFAPELRERRVATTDVEGLYEFKELPAGRYTLGASKAGYINLQFGQRRPFEPGRPVELRDAQVLEKVDFALPRGSVITGHVSDEYGEPVSDAQVRVMRYQYMDGQRRMSPVGFSQSNDLGQYRAFGLAPGEYYVSAVVRSGSMGAESEETTGYAPTYYPGTPNAAEALRVSLALGQELSNVDFPLVPTRTARIFGSALDSSGKPLANAFVMLVQSEGAGMMASTGAQVRPDGSFTVSNVPPGDYSLEVRSSLGPMDPNAESASVPVKVTGDDIHGIHLATNRGATVRGEVVFAGGAQPSFTPGTVQIMAGPSSFPVVVTMIGPPARVQDDWTFQVSGLRGSRLIRVGGLPPGWSLKAIMLNGQDVTDTPLEFKSTEEVTGLQVVLTNRTTEVLGTVTNDRGELVKDYIVVAFADDRERWAPRSRFILTGRPDQDGAFKIRGLPPEAYLAVAVEYVQQGQWSDPEFLEQMRERATRFTLGEGEQRALGLKLAPMQ